MDAIHQIIQSRTHRETGTSEPAKAKLFAIQLAKLGSFQITGLDISKTFVEIARRNAQEAETEVDFRQGDIARMPFENESFDFLVCRAAFKNFSDPVRAVQKMYRVLKPGKHVLVIDLRRDASRQEVNQHVDAMGLDWFSAPRTKLTFRFMLLKRTYTRHEFEQFFAQAGFRRIEVQTTPIGLEVLASIAACIFGHLSYPARPA